MRVLLVTNDFPPRVGGIQRYLWSLYRDLPQHGVDVRVLAPAHPGDAAFDDTAFDDTAFDAGLPFEVVRHDGPIYWPTPALRATVATLAKGSDAVAFGAVLPMNLLAPKIDRPVVVHTHGFEVAWTKLPVLRATLRRIARASSLMTTVSRYCHRAIEQVVPRRTDMKLLVTGVDLDRFHPNLDATSLRARYGLGDKPVVACISRLVLRKGQDLLIHSMEQVRAAVPGATLLVVGGGPADRELRAMAARLPDPSAVVFTGEVAEEELPLHYAAGDVFAMPCRSRFGGLEVEGLGLVYLEAQACGRPAIAGDSGGAPEAVVEGETGFVVGGRDADALARRLIGLLGDPERARRIGSAGRAFVERQHRWSDIVERYASLLRAL